jgi:hypothetical protein
MRTRLLPVLLVLLGAGCSNAGEDLGLPPLATGTARFNVFLDRDGTGTLTGFDTSFGGARIALFMRGGIDTFRVGNTASDGEANFTDLPLGRYSFAIVPASLGDTLPVTFFAQGEFDLRADVLAGVGSSLVSYATLDLEAARQAQAGRPVFIHGVVSSPLQFFSDSGMFLTSGGSYLRITGASHRPGRTGNNIGDSVVVFGRTGTDAGQPVLLNGVVLTLGTQMAPTPVDVSVAEVMTARGGELDAALVRVDHAAIGDTATVGGQFTVWIVDTLTPADTARVVFDPLLQVNTTGFAIDRGFISRGVLVPDGVGTWFLKPRPVNGEVVLN